MVKVTQEEIVGALIRTKTSEMTRTLLAIRIQTEGIAPPDGMALVPIEPTEEMMLAAEEAYTPFGDMGMALICGNLAAAPKQENSNE